MSKKIYLDNAATSFPKPEVLIHQITDALKNERLTTSRRGYTADDRVADLVQKTRSDLLNFIGGGRDDKLIFTLNATEAINIVLRSNLKKGDHVITSSMEHSAVTRTLNALKREGVRVSVVKPNREVKISCKAITSYINSRTRLIALIHGSNVTGNIIADLNIFQLTQKKNILFLLDASQTVGNYLLDISKFPVDFIAFSAHKGLMGPPGVGCLYVKDYIPLSLFRYGGTGENAENDFLVPEKPSDYETGTQNVVGIMGLHASLSFINEIGLKKVISYKKELMSYCLDKLKDYDEIVLYGDTSAKDRLPILSFNVKGLSPAELGSILYHGYGIICRSGLHCSPWCHKYIGTFPHGTIRISFGYFNSKEDCNALANALEEIILQYKEML